MARIGEVVESDTNGFLVQSYELYKCPALGSLVRVGTNDSVFGIVCHSTTVGIDPSRLPIARGEFLKDEDDVYDQNPQLSRLLKTQFRSIAVGYKNMDEIKPFLPPYPPRIHSFAYDCSEDDIKGFANSHDLFRMVLLSGLPQSDDVVASFVKNCAVMMKDPSGYKREASRILASVISGDSQRINSLLRRLE